LSSVGRELARAGANALRQLQGVDDLVNSLRAGSSIHTRIVTSSTPGTYLLPQVIAKFLRAHEDAHIDIEVVPMPRLWETFVSGGYDIAVAPRMPFDATVTAEPLCVDRVVVFTAPGHPLAHRSHVGFGDLRDVTLVGKFAESFWGQVHYILRERGFTWAHQVDLRSAEAVKRIVSSGDGVGILFASSLDHELAGGSLVALNITEPVFEQTYFLVVPKIAQTPLAKAFCDFLRAEW
jgi:DNA-binding transcriptional LysR family regulator